MEDEEKKFVNEEKEEESEEKMEEVETGKTEKGSSNKFAGIVSVIFKILVFPFKLLFKFFTKYPKVFLVIILILAAIGGTIYIARTKPKLLGISTEQDVMESQKDVDILLSEVGKLIRLPQDENPTVATVTDADTLKSQPFFAEAQNGDKVLIYANSKKIYLYRPSEKKIIEASIINISPKTDTEDITGSPVDLTQTPQVTTVAVTPTRSP